MTAAAKDDLAAYHAYLREMRDGDSSHEEFVTDMLASLRHFCDTYAVDFAEVDRIAYMHYLAERMEA